MPDRPPLRPMDTPTSAELKVSGSRRGAFVEWLLAARLIAADAWRELSAADRDEILDAPGRAASCQILVDRGLLTDYQAQRILNGRHHGLVLNNYRILERLGAGGMGVVFKAENIALGRPVAIKIVTGSGAPNDPTIRRFYTEARAVARLQHPNIVTAIDAGMFEEDSGPCEQHYFVMEYVPGRDLEAMIRTDGPLPVPMACGVAYQICGALAEAHRHGLIHRDIKLSNIMVTARGQAKLLDFGLARVKSTPRLTAPGVLLGTIGFMPPEQAADPAAVDCRADLYALGVTLYWCLTGSDPFPAEGAALEAIARRAAAAPLRPRSQRPSIPPALDDLVARMTAPRPEDRPACALAVMKHLLAFMTTGPAEPVPVPVPVHVAETGEPVPRVLVVDDEKELRKYCQMVLRNSGCACGEAADGAEAIERLREEPYDVVLLDLTMPGISGLEVLQQIRQLPMASHLKVIIITGWSETDVSAKVLAAGADELLQKPLNGALLSARVHAAVRLKRAEERVEQQMNQIAALVEQTEHEFADRAEESDRQRDGLLLAIGSLVDLASGQSPSRSTRIRAYCRCLGEAVCQSPAFRERFGASELKTLCSVAPLYDVGKLTVPAGIMRKPDRLDSDERAFMQSHATAGEQWVRILVGSGALSPQAGAVATRIARSHHERFDGSGYPDKLIGEEIPLEARIVAIADVYDALRSRRSHRPGASHQSAFQVICETPGWFDPKLLELYVRVSPEFDAIYQRHGGLG